MAEGARRNERIDRRNRRALFGRRRQCRQRDARRACRGFARSQDFAERSGSETPPHDRIRKAGQHRIGTRRLTAFAHEGDERLGLLSGDRDLAGHEDAHRTRHRARALEPALAHERAAAHEVADRREQRAAVAGAARFGMAQQRLEPDAVRKVVPQERDEPRVPGIRARTFARHEPFDRTRQRAREHHGAERFTERTQVCCGDEAREREAHRVERARAVGFARDRSRSGAEFADVAHRGDDVGEHVARAERYAHDVADLDLELGRHRVGQLAIEARRFQLREHVDDPVSAAGAGHRNSTAPGGEAKRPTMRRNVARGIRTSASTSPIACGTTKRVSGGKAASTALGSIRSSKSG